MNKLIINNPKEEFPKITLDQENNIFEISGKSMPENATVIYAPIINWLKEYIQNPNPETIFCINLDYFNSSSSKKIFEILMLLEQLTESGKNIKVKWYFDENEDVMYRRSQDIQDVVNVPIEFIKKIKK